MMHFLEFFHEGDSFQIYTHVYSIETWDVEIQMQSNT